MKKILSCGLIIWLLFGSVPQYEVEAASNVIAVEMELYSTSGTPVYATDNVLTNVSFYLERFTLVKVTGITTSGFYRVDIGGTYYIPGAFLVAQISALALQLDSEDLHNYSGSQLFEMHEKLGSMANCIIKNLQSRWRSPAHENSF